MTMTAECIFCKIAAKHLSADIVYEDDDVMAFQDIHPRYPTHILVIPKAHLGSASEAAPAHDALLGKLLRVGAQIASDRGLRDRGFRLLTNAGPDSGQVVDHLHIHLLGGERLRPL